MRDMLICVCVYACVYVRWLVITDNDRRGGCHNFIVNEKAWSRGGGVHILLIYYNYIVIIQLLQQSTL